MRIAGTGDRYVTLAGPLTWYRTLRHLRPSQIYGRLNFAFAAPAVDLRPAPGLRETSELWTAPALREPSFSAPATFRFLSKTRDLDTHGWDDPAIDKLWRYNLHYFDDLNAAGARDRTSMHRGILERWVEENRPCRGTGWEPYPTAIRIVNWIKWSLAGQPLPMSCVQSLATQARWLSRRIEWHLMGNHLFTNAKALVFAGLYFQGPEADNWLETGARIIAGELRQQILADGGHFELSPMYHAIILEDLLDLVNAASAWPDSLSPEFLAQWRARIAPMLLWLRRMSHPDGDIAFFNDAAFGVASTPQQVENYAARLGFGAPAGCSEGVHDSPATGYVRLQNEDAVVFADIASIGPDYLPAHAHADTLSCEVSLNRERFLVNSGTSTYQIGRERTHQRGTGAHNTLVVDRLDSSEMWAGFRVGRRARVVERAVGMNTTLLWARGAHDGYRHLRGQPVHRREWRLSSKRLEIVDELQGRGRHDSLLVWHLHPLVHMRRMEDAKIGLKRNRVHAIIEIEGGDLVVEPCTWHPAFGASEPTSRIVVHRDGRLPHRLVTRLVWNTIA